MKKAIVVGASSGIGEGLAKLLAENGYKVGITGRRGELLEELKKTKPDSFFVKAFDVTDTRRTVGQLEELASEIGGLDLLVLSSGTGELNEMLDYEIERQVIDLNVIGFTNIAAWSYKYFEKQGRGHLVAISSVAGIRGSRVAPSYNATKSYQMNYLEGLRQKSARSKKPVFVTDIRPGLVATQMAKGEGLFWVMPVDKTVKQIYKAIKARKKVAYVTRRWRFIAAILRQMPRSLYDRM